MLAGDLLGLHAFDRQREAQQVLRRHLLGMAEIVAQLARIDRDAVDPQKQRERFEPGIVQGREIGRGDAGTRRSSGASRHTTHGHGGRSCRAPVWPRRSLRSPIARKGKKFWLTATQAAVCLPVDDLPFSSRSRAVSAHRRRVGRFA